MTSLTPFLLILAQQPQMAIQNDTLSAVAQYSQNVWNLEIRLKTGEGEVTVLKPGEPQAGRFPTLHAPVKFAQCVVNGKTMTLTGMAGDVAVTRKITINGEAKVDVEDQFALDGAGQKVTQLGSVWTTTDTTSSIFTPGGGDFLADPEFRTPFVLAEGSKHDCLLTPDIAALSASRPLPLVLAKSGPDSFAYGWGALDGSTGSWALSQTPRAFSGSAKLKYSLRFPAPGTNFTPASTARMLWTEWEPLRRENPLPQTLPYWYMTKPIYDMLPTPEENMRAPEGANIRTYWWEGEIGGLKVGAPHNQARVEWGGADNTLRAAYGLRYWGVKLGQPSWVTRADNLAGLTLAGFDAVKGMPSSFRFSNKSFEREADMNKASASAVWLLRLAREEGFPHREQAMRAVNSISLGPDASGLSSWRLALAAELADDSDRLEALAAAGLAWNKGFDAGHVEALTVLAGKLNKRELIQKAASLMEEYAINQAAWDMNHVTDLPLLGALGEADILNVDSIPEAWMLLKVGEVADDAVLFERGAIAQRSFVNLIYFNINAANGLAMPVNVPVDRMAGGYSPDAFRAWPGFDKGEGQFLTNAALIDKEYGAFYRSQSGWAVGIDGLEANAQLEPVDLLARCPMPFGSHSGFDMRDPGGRRTVDSPIFEPNVRALTIEWIDDEPHVVAHPGFVPQIGGPRPTGEFILADGTRLKAAVKAQGLAAPVRPNQAALGPISFVGSMDGQPVSFRPTHLFITPPLEPSIANPRGWQRTGGLVASTAPTLKLDNSLAFSTADDGSGRVLNALIGGLESPAFLILDSEISFRVQANRDCTIRLIEPLTGSVLRQYVGSTGQVESVIWDLTPFRGQKVVIRITDNSRTGSITVGSMSMQ